MSFHGAPTRHALIVTCKGCQRPVPARITSIPDNAVIVLCPLYKEKRYYRPSEIHEGRITFDVGVAR